MLQNLKMTIEYDGTGFNGWQIQPKNQRTVQDEIEKAIRTIFKTKVRITASGRTDSGTHALGQVANFKIKTDKSCNEIKRALNANLPEDITIINVCKAPDAFHAQYSVQSKMYRYTILNREERCVLQRHLCLHYPYKLNLRLIREEVKCLLGRHNFKSFQGADASKKHKDPLKDTIRTIHKIDIKKRKEFISIEIEANGFLYKMVRNIVGTLLAIGSGQLPKGSMKKILDKKNRNYAGYTAKSLGLTLVKVNY